MVGRRAMNAFELLLGTLPTKKICFIPEGGGGPKGGERAEQSSGRLSLCPFLLLIILHGQNLSDSTYNRNRKNTNFDIHNLPFSSSQIYGKTER